MINLTLKFIINKYDIYIIGILRENNRSEKMGWEIHCRKFNN